MLIIGSEALRQWGYPVVPKDLDMIMTFEEFQAWQKRNKSLIKLCVPTDEKSFHVVDIDGRNVEVEIAWPGSSGAALLEEYEDAYAPLNVLLALKLSHRYKKDSVHFLKTMRDIQFLREQGAELSPWLKEWLPWREKETYTNNLPKLNVSKGEFFAGDGVNYVYEHDSIHLAVALDQHYFFPEGSDELVSVGVPAYTRYMKEGSEVMTSKEKFFSVGDQARLYGVYEETCVLALERSQIPYDFAPDARWSFEKALEKVCTSITGGWFRCWAYDNYDKVLDLYAQQGETDYIERFKGNAHLLKPYVGESMQ